MHFSQIGQVELLSYPFEKCGSLHVGANLDEMMRWLDHVVDALDYLIISADGLFSGGLVQARLGVANAAAVEQALTQIKIYKERYPKLKIYVFDTVMRTSITAYDEESERYWAKMNEYSRLKGRIFFFNQREDKIKLDVLKQDIPLHIIQTYEKARNTKYQITRKLITYVKENIIDYVLVLQEDAMPNGVQKIEQLNLEEMVKELSLGQKVKFYNGTDEGGAILLGRAILEINHSTPKVYIHLPEPDALKKVMPFEDRPFQVNLDLMLESFGYITVPTPKEADFVLAVYTEEEDYNLILEVATPIVPRKNEVYLTFMQSLEKMLGSKKPVAFVDLLFPNGGSIDILEDLSYKKLLAYSAWNTASNSMGSLLCDVASKLVSKSKSKEFLYERILDDCLYQYIVRREINHHLLSKAVNVYDLKTATQEVTQMIQKRLEEVAKPYNLPKFKIWLPWERTFELDIELEE